VATPLATPLAASAVVMALLVLAVLWLPAAVALVQRAGLGGVALIVLGLVGTAAVLWVLGTEAREDERHARRMNGHGEHRLDVEG
jgi:multisubunit Na+/H+ antiporter MnhB subunit